MRLRFPARLRSLQSRQDGTSVVEFGLLAPILAVTLMGVVDFSMGYSSKLALEQAAFRALEKITDGTVQPDYSFLAAEAATAAGVPVSQVTVANWLECNRVAQPSFSGTCPGGQEVSKYVRVTITSTYQPMFFEGPLAVAMDGDGNVPLTAAAAVRVQ